MKIGPAEAASEVAKAVFGDGADADAKAVVAKVE